MADPKGFQQFARQSAPKRPAAERVRDHKHVYQSMPLRELRTQASRCMDCGVPFCTTGCPLGNLIPDWNDLVREDRWQNAITRLHLTNNFPEFTGMLCPAPCEAACVLAVNDDAVAIKEIELAIVTRAFDEGWIVAQPPSRRSGQQVAVIGSGPAGLAVAQQLNRIGHRVVVFEKDDKIGGLLRYGIPDFKIEKWVVDRRVDLLRAEGIEFVPNAYAGQNPTAGDLRAEFDAVVLAVGALQGRDVRVPGRDFHGIHLAMDYLTQQNRRVAGEQTEHRISATGKRVVILGGGDTSADCLGNVLREEPHSVQVLTHGPCPPDVADPLTWPDWPFVLRTHPAHEEGGERHWSLALTGFSGNEGRVECLHTVRAEWTPARRIRHVDGTEQTIAADLVLLAIGFAGPVRDRLLQDLGVSYGPSGALETDGGYGTSAPGVFTAGDAKRGASLIVWAIADGRKAALETNRYLNGKRAGTISRVS